MSEHLNPAIVERSPSEQLWASINAIEYMVHSNGLLEHSPHETIRLISRNEEEGFLTYELGYVYLEKEGVYGPQLQVTRSSSDIYEWFEQADENTGIRLELPSQICTHGEGELVKMKEHAERMKHLMQRNAKHALWRLIEA